MSGFKDLGPNVSETPQDTGVGGQFSGEEKSLESVVIQEDAPVIDWEMNLRTDVVNDHGFRRSNQLKTPTCFLGGDFLEHPDVLGSFVMLAPAIGDENQFRMLAQEAIVNGWPVRIEYSDISTAGLNEITLTAPPVAGSRVDLVILEVWRALVRASPEDANKSPTALILRHGNVKAPDAVNLADDLIDPTYSLESSARVQIQYRLRVVEDVDLASFPDGIDDPAVVAHTVSDFGGPGADGTATVRTFSPAAGDGGLWTAGNADSADATLLGTVDGLMYATPVCAVARRNSTAFDKDSNLNGGTLIASGTSDRPDGLFADQVVAEDVIDLRRGCSSDFEEVLDKAVQQIFDNTLQSSLETTALGTAGTVAFFRDDIALVGPPKMGSSDNIRRHFSDRSVTDVIVAKADLTGGVTTLVDFSLSALTLSWDSSPTDVLLNSPPGTTLTGFGRARIVIDDAIKDNIDVLDPASGVKIIRSEFRVDVGSQIDELHIELDGPPPFDGILYVELLVTYRPGHGTSRNMIRAHDFWVHGTLPAWVDTSFLTATTDADRTSLDTSLWEDDPVHREVAVHLQTVSQAGVVFITSAVDELLIWERLNGDPITIDDGTNPPYATTNYTQNTNHTVVQLTGAVAIPADTVVMVDYVAYRPLPLVAGAPDDSYNLFYSTAAIQSILPPAGTQTLNLVPRSVSKQLYVIGSSTGSPDSPFPFGSPGEQVPVGALPAPDFPESKIDNPASISVVGFGVNTGFLQLPTLVPYAPNPSEVTLFRDAPDAVTDAEGRNFWPKSDDGSPAKYSPVAFGQELASPQTHKVAYPFLAELAEDFDSIGRKGSLVVVLVTNWIAFDPANSVTLNAVVGTSGAGVFRVKGRMLNPRRVDP